MVLSVHSQAQTTSKVALSNDTEVAWTADEIAYLNKRSPIKVGVYGKNMPYCHILRNGKYEGISADVLKRLAVIMPVKFEIIPYNTSKTCVEKLQASLCDIVPMLDDRFRQTPGIILSRKLFTNKFILLSTINTDHIGKIKELDNESILIEKDNPYYDELKQLYPKLTFVPVTNLSTGLTQLNKGPVKFMTAELRLASYAIFNNNLLNLKIAGETEFKNHYGFGFRTDDVKLKTLFNKALAKIDSLEEQSMVQNYFAIQYDENLNFRDILKYVIGATIIIILIIAWNRKLSSLNQRLKKANEAINAAHNELAFTHEQLKVLAVRDRLTGLYNRVRLDEALEYEKERAIRYQTPFSIILLDVDHFKKINDDYGHLVGDHVLMEVARILQNSVRKTDILGRWGGEEFLIICPETDLESCAAVAEKIRSTLQAHPFERIGCRTASFGVAACAMEDNVDSCIAQADTALYQAKAQGRNRVCVSDRDLFAIGQDS